MTFQSLQRKKLALCIDAGEYEGSSLFAMKLYEYLPDAASEKQGFLRVVEEEGEPYYYDTRAFLKITTRPNGLTIPFASSRKSRSKRAQSKTRKS